ncbi:hypothetical protein ABZU45_28090 [Streptomyces avermitilis]|uniref:hypothetical protein n=1 Tax=Streptomyces avermitilis TaxID=33903 RepID=UPI0033A1D7BA
MKQWVVAFRTTLIQPLLEADDPMTLEQIAQVLLEWAPGNEDGLAGPGRAGSELLRHFLTGRGETSVQRMVAGQRVPSRDVVLDLLQLVEDRVGRPDRAAVERLWQLHRPALVLEARALADAYQLIDERDAALLQSRGLRQQADALGADRARAVFRLAQAGSQLTTAHRELVTVRRELDQAAGQKALADVGEQQARSELERAADRLDRLRDAYEQLQDQAQAAQSAAADETGQWQERQALLLERLARAQEVLAVTVQEAGQARQALAEERRATDAARQESRQARQEAAAGQAAADTARQKAAADQARHHREQASAQETIRSAQRRYTEALQALADLDAELRQVRGALKQSQKRLIRADAQLAQVLSERAVESDAQEVLSRALTAMQADEHFSGNALIAAGPESTPAPRSGAITPDQHGAGIPPSGSAGAGTDPPPKPPADDPGTEDDGAPSTTGDFRGKAPARTQNRTPAAGEAEYRTPPPTRRRPGHRVDNPPLPAASALKLKPYRSPGYGRRLALVVSVAVTVAAGVPALVWWSWNPDTSHGAGHESPTPSATAKAASLPPRPAPDTVADIGDQPVNTAAVMKLPDCARSFLSLRLTSADNTYTDRDPHLTLTIKAPKGMKRTPCRVNASRSQTVVTLTPADQEKVVWKSSSCASGHDGPRWVQLAPAHPVTVDFHWNRRTAGKDCEKDRAVPYGTYLAEALLTDSITSLERTSFVLARKEAKAHTTPTPSVTPTASRKAPPSTGTTSGGSGSTGGSIGGLLTGGGGQSSPTLRASTTPSEEANGANGGGDNGGGFFGGPTG